MTAPYLVRDIFWRKISLLFILSLATAMGVGCKSKSGSKGGGAAPAAPIDGADAQGAEGECGATLNLVTPLPSTVPGALVLDDVNLENIKNDSSTIAKVTFKLRAGSAIPDKYIYDACSAKRPNDCERGSTTIGEDYNPNVPEGAVKLTGWACVRSGRIQGSLATYSANRVALGGEYFYCGPPEERYVNKDSNAGNESLAHQTLKKSLEEKRDGLAHDIVKIVQEYVNDPSITNKGAESNVPWINLANGNYHSAAAISWLYWDAVSATVDGLQRNQAQGGSTAKTSLSLSEDGSNCIPVPDPGTVSTDPVPFTPPAVSTPDAPPMIEPDPVVEGNIATAEEPQVEVKKEPEVNVAEDHEKACQTRNEWFQSQELGTAVWDAEVQRCFHVSEQGQKTEIDVSIDPSTLNPPPGVDEVEVEVAEGGMSGWQKTGVALMAIGGTIGAVGGASYFGSEKISQVIKNKVNTDVEIELKKMRSSVKSKATPLEDLSSPNKSTSGLFDSIKKGDAASIKKGGRNALLVGFAMFALGGILGSGALGLSGDSANTDLHYAITTDKRYQYNMRAIGEINSMIEVLKESIRKIAASGSDG